MDGSGSDIQVDMRKFSMGSSGGGSFREQLESSSPLLRVTMPGPGSWATDALTCSWPRKVTYAFPSTCLILQFIRRLKRLDDFRCLLVAPWSPAGHVDTSANSFPGIHYLPIPVSKGMLVQPQWEYLNPSPHNLQLHLWFLRGVASEN